MGLIYSFICSSLYFLIYFPFLLQIYSFLWHSYDSTASHCYMLQNNVFIIDVLELCAFILAFTVYLHLCYVLHKIVIQQSNISTN